jgi:hypothetical protein
VAGRELGLPSWREWSARDPLEQRAVEQMVLGVSTGGYARSLEPLPEAVAVRRISKSAVSERFVYGTERKLAELMSRDLRKLRVVALLIDGVHFGEHVVLAAVGVDEHGDEHVLGLREGATENAAAVRALLADLVERGLDPNRALLIVIGPKRCTRRWWRCSVRTGRMLGDDRAYNLPAIVSQNDHHVKQPKRCRRHDEHVDGGDPLSLIAKKAPPGRRRRHSSSQHVFGHAGLADLDAELEQLVVDPGRTSERVGGAHLSNQNANLAID